MWEPIAEGERAARVWRAVDDIADELAARTSPAADLALFWTYLATARDTERDEARRAAALDAFAAELARGYDRPWLFEGLAGAGFAAAHVASNADDVLAVIDARLAELLASWRGSFDLASGVAGFAVYFLEREGPAGARGLALAVDQLARTAEHTADGATWKTQVDHLAPRDRADWPDGVYDCGVAHGVAGVIGVLARIAARPDAPVAAAPLAADATRWLLAQRGASQLYGTRRAGSRAGWCYGSPGTALALGGRADLADWLDLAPEATGAVGPGLCHGAATLVHAANRMYQATREPRFRVAALAALDRLLALPRPFATLETGDRAAAILTGSAGAGLALLATVTDLEPAWDRTLLCDVATSSEAAESSAPRAD